MTELERLVKEFFELIDKREENDEGTRHFFPNKLEISTCRVLDGKRLGELVEGMRKLVGAPDRRKIF